MNVEGPNMERRPLSNEQVFLEGVLHEWYCTLCGVPFHLSQETRGWVSKDGVDCFAWAGYFIGCK